VPRQAQNRRRLGIGLLYPSDELYLRAGFPVPPATEYDGFPQLENGIGLVRRMLDEWEKIKADGIVSQEGRVVAICGTLIAPLLGRVAQELSQLSKLDISVVPVENAFFGSSVTVSGLLVGQDVVEAVRHRDLGDMVLLPRAMFDAQGEVTLDDLTAEEMESRLGVAVRAASSVAEMMGCAGGNARVAGQCAG
jgi:NifB/MoaA-like Fe-S oxidoreductase